MLANREDALLHMLGLWNHIFTHLRRLLRYLLVALY